MGKSTAWRWVFCYVRFIESFGISCGYNCN